MAVGGKKSRNASEDKKSQPATLQLKKPRERVQKGQQVEPSNAEEASEEDMKSNTAIEEENDEEEKEEESEEVSQEEDPEEELRPGEDWDLPSDADDEVIFSRNDDLAMLTGLKTRPDLEGDLVIVRKWDVDKERYVVHILSDPDLESFNRVRMHSLTRLKVNWPSLQTCVSMCVLCYLCI